VRVQKAILFISYIVILTAVTSCNAPSTTPSSLPEVDSLDVDTECSPIYECELEVTIGPFTKAMTVTVELQLHDGITLNTDASFQSTSNSSAGETRTEYIHLQPQDKRIVRFPFTINSQIMLAGEYVLVVKLLDVDKSNLIGSYITKVLVYADMNGNVRLMRTESDFRDEYGKYYDEVDNDAHYRVLLDPGERPTRGYLFVKLIAPHSEYDPVLTIHSDGGVEFERIRPVFICADEGGSRVVRFSFRIIEDEYQQDGRYTFSIAIVEDGNILAHEIAPVAVDLVSEAYTHTNQWLTLVQHITSVPITTPIEEDDGSSRTGYSQTVSTADESIQDQSQQCDLPDTSPMSKNGGNDSDVDGGTSHISKPIAAHETSSTGGKPNTDSVCANWQQIHIANQLELVDVYRKHVDGKAPDMDWVLFTKWFWICNGMDNQVVVLPENRTYYLPRGSSPK